MLNISKDEKRYTEIELDLHKKLAYEKGRASIIEEFEKLKTKINDCEHFKYDSDHFGINLWDVNNIIDKRISELEGENNE